MFRQLALELLEVGAQATKNHASRMKPVGPRQSTAVALALRGNSVAPVRPFSLMTQSSLDQENPAPRGPILESRRFFTEDTYRRFAPKKQEPDTLDWKNLGFVPRATDFITSAICVDGTWEKSTIRGYGPMVVAPVSLDYSPTGFEGIKAFRQKDGSICIWNLDPCVARLQRSMQRIGMTPISTEQAKELIQESVLSNERFLPPYVPGDKDPAAMYIRPMFTNLADVFGVQLSKVVGVQVTVGPVGSYYGAGGVKPIDVKLSSMPRSLAGTGDHKLGPNYAPTMKPRGEAMSEGFKDLLYPTVETAGLKNPVIAEFSSANLALFRIEDGKPVLFVNENDQILPSTTKAALKLIAQDLGYHVRVETITLDMLRQGGSVVAIGTAAVMSPVGSLTVSDKDVISFETSSDQPAFSAMERLKEAFLQTQTGERLDIHKLGYIIPKGKRSDLLEAMSEKVKLDAGLS